jgi:hypothetical protein
MTDKTDERRQADRHPVYTTAEMLTDAGEVKIAITQDASDTGLLLMTRAKLEVEQKIKIRIHLHDGQPPRVLDGRVVRRMTLPPGVSPLWREQVAVQLDESAPDVAAALKDLATRESAPPTPPEE